MLNWIYSLKAKLQEKLSEKGQGMVEYALIIAVVAVIAALVLNTNLKNAVTGAFENAGEQITNATDTIGEADGQNNNNNNNNNGGNSGNP